MSVYSEVTSVFSNAQAYAAAAKTDMATFTTALNNLVYAPPTISVTWNSVTAPTLPSLPSVPTMPTIAFTAPAQPDGLVLTAPDLTLDTFTEVAPTTSFPAAPTLSYGAAPTVPDATAVDVPAAPTITLPSIPTYLTLSTPTFAGVDLNEAFLSNLTTIPTLTLASPTPYSYSPGADYASALLSAVQAKLNERLAGGTGLPAAVEQAIWDRARSRETNAALANEAEIMRNSEALGFHLPAGVLAVQLREAQQNYYDKLSTLSRDIGIKQAELEQSNLKDTIAAGIDLEGKLVDYSFKLEQLTFESAKVAAENSIQSYNAQVDNYKALLSAYQTYATVYKTIIDGQLAKVEVYKAELQAEQIKADANKTLVEQYKAQISAVMSGVEVFRAQVEGAKVLVELEQIKIATAGEQIKAYAAQVNAETAKVEAYKAGVSAEATKVDVYKTKATAFSAVVGAQAEQLRTQLSYYEGLTRAKALEWDGYRAQVEAERARLGALTAQSSTMLDGYKAGAASIEASANMHARIWETQIKDYEASQQIAIQAAKINGDFTIAANNSRLDAAKVGAQVYAQLTSSAYSMIHASAGISAGASMSVGYSYSNDTTTAVSPVTAI